MAGKLYSSGPKTIASLRPQTNREQWLNTLYVGHPVDHLSLGGGYIHQCLFQLFQKDAKALKIKFLFHNIHHLEHHVLVPEMRKQLHALNLSTAGDYVELRQRLGIATRMFDTEFTQEKLHAQAVLSMMRQHQKKNEEEKVNAE